MQMAGFILPLSSLHRASRAKPRFSRTSSVIRHMILLDSRMQIALALALLHAVPVKFDMAM